MIRKFEIYFDKRGWKYTTSIHEKFIQYKIKDLDENKANINFYNTGTILVQGSETKLKKTLVKMKEKVDKYSGKSEE